MERCIINADNKVTCNFDQKNIKADGAVRNLTRQVRERKRICVLVTDTLGCITAAGGSLQMVLHGQPTLALKALDGRKS